MTADDLTDRFLATLLRAHGGTKRRWRSVLGGVKTYPRETHPHCNWTLSPSGSAQEVAAVEDIADRLRAEVPLIDG